MTRLSIITTRTGDQGTTGLADGTRLSKASTRIAALGDADELNCHIGLIRTNNLPSDIDNLLSRIQHDLFDLGAELCLPGHKAIHDEDIKALEEAIEHYNASLGKLEEFILPGGSLAAAQTHIARAICRRAERFVVALELEEEESARINPQIKQYLNRLSDLLFVLARAINKAAGTKDVFWNKQA